MKTKIIALLSISWILTNAFAQDPNFSQFYEMPMLRNPALIGLSQCNFHARSIYRNQWQSVTVPYQTRAASVDMRFASQSGAWHSIGLQFLQDVAGDSRLERVQVLPDYTLHLPVGRNNGFLSLGVMAGPVSSHFDASKLTWNDQFVNGQFSSTNPTSQVLKNTNINYLDINAGVVFSQSLENYNWYGGLALYHANNPSISFDPNNSSKLRTKTALNAGLVMPTGSFDSFEMYADAYFQAGGQQQYMLGGLYIFSLDGKDYYDESSDKTQLQFGGFYRWNDAVIPTVKLEYGSFSFGLSYDINVSKLKTASQGQGGFEFTLIYHNCQLGNRDGSIICPCPKF